MKTNVWNYSNEYLGYCENQYGGHVYDWKYDEATDVVHLEWKLGKYSYDLKKNFEIEAYNILKRFPTVCIKIEGLLMTVYPKPIEQPNGNLPNPPEPKPIEQPKPPVVQPKPPVEPNKPTEPPIVIEPTKPQEEEKSALQSFIAWLLSIFKRG